MGEQIHETLDLSNLARMLKERRGSLSLRQAAAEAGVSFSTFTRVEAGSQPDIVSFTKLCAWLGVSPSEFFTSITVRQMSRVEDIVHQVRTDPTLSKGSAEHIANMIRQLYSVLSKPRELKQDNLRVIRAASMLRPGTPARFRALIVDLEAALVERSRLDAPPKFQG
jgi:transcriptional regulator with XRE-family HTH domain